MHPDAVVQADIHAGGSFIDVPASERDEAYGELAQLRLGQRKSRPALWPMPPVDPQLPRAVDEDIRDCRVRHKGGEFAELGQVPRGWYRLDGAGWPDILRPRPSDSVPSARTPGRTATNRGRASGDMRTG
ncbi:hypothetical protein GCM10022239_11570 [Leifsonia bigeumensis]|uniref:Uncharacterized protein n=1 Tax=Leifsonella bigeumensis TaxID=433643 RepID=A0ABP7FE95_9MICO